MEAMFFSLVLAGVTQLARVTAFQAVGRGFESRLPLYTAADVAQLVEHILGKDEVTGSIPVVSSKKFRSKQWQKVI
jgi:hypothetical protein